MPNASELIQLGGLGFIAVTLVYFLMNRVIKALDKSQETQEKIAENQDQLMSLSKLNGSKIDLLLGRKKK